jgi:putative membrane protein
MQSGRLAFVACAAIAVTLGASSQSDEQVFVRDAVQSNLGEVQLGELAVQRAESDTVRKFGETLRTDHQAALQRATNLAKSLKVEAPAEPSIEARGIYDGLSQLSGAQFDAAFVSHMITVHESAIAKYSRNANSDHDGVAAMVADALPKLKAHLATAQALQKGAPVHPGH